MEQGLHQGCVLASSLFGILFVGFRDVAYTRFEADKDIIDALVHLREKPGARGSNSRRASPGDVTLGHAVR